jgi:hypothetical protein
MTTMNQRKYGLPQKPGANRLTGQQTCAPQPHKPCVTQPKIAHAGQVKNRPVSPPVYTPQAKSQIVQQKTASPSQMGTPPATPPVYRPQLTPKVLQTKTASVQQSHAHAHHQPVAPPVYRPQQVPKVLQTKSASSPSPHTGQAPRRPVAPPVYRPEAKKIVQPKAISQQRMSPTAPPVYRPEQKRVAQPKMASAAQAHTPPKSPLACHPQPKQVNAPPRIPAQMKSNVVVSQANRPKTVRQQKTDNAAGNGTLGPSALALNRHDRRARFANGKPESIQLYSVLPPERVLHEMPTMVGKREPDRPYAVVAGAEFLAQQSLPERYGYDKGHDFLREPSIGCQEAWIVGRLFGQSLRLSDDGNMAIEDTDLSRRQPKEFYATSTIVRESNQALQRVGARVSLIQGAHALTIVTAKGQVIALYTVTPHFAKAPPQNCNAMAAEVIGSSSGFTAMKKAAGMNAAKKIAVDTQRLLARAFHDKQVTAQQFDKLEGTLVEEYVSKLPQSQDILEREQINQYAKPGVGEAFMIGTLGNPTNQNGSVARVLDLESGEERALGWGFHFAGVVAVSGNDRVTLENYARGDDRRDDADPRWFFQMYGGTAGQTFYDFNKAKGGFSNPVAVAVGK